MNLLTISKMKRLTLWNILWAAAFILILPAAALTPAEQADHFHARGVAAEARGEPEVAGRCYELALRASPGHPATREKLRALGKKKADDLVALGAAAEAKGDLQTANLQYVLALQASPGHGEAEKKTAALKAKMGPEFKEGGELILAEKLRRIVIPVINFEDNTVAEAVDFLYRRSRDLDTAEPDPAKKGVNIVIRKLRGGDSDTTDPGRLRIRELRLRNVPLEQCLKYICEQTKLRYSVDSHAVTLHSINNSKQSVSPPPLKPTPPAPVDSIPAWTSTDGKEIKAWFVRVEGAAVVARGVDGRELKIPVARLSDKSKAQAKVFAEVAADVLLHYDFSDSSGTTVADRSGNGRHGTLAGFADTNAGAGDTNLSGWMKDGALRFDGQNDSVSTPLAVKDLGTGGYTLEAVVSHLNPQSSWAPVIAVDATSYRTPGVIDLGKIGAGNWTSHATALSSRHNGTTEAATFSTHPTSIGDGRLHHVAAVYDPEVSEIRLYFDHLLIERKESTGSLNRVGPSALGNLRFLIGANGWAPSERWFGPISEVRIAKRALSPGQFLPNPNPLTATPPAPKHRWSFSGDLKDSIGGAHGTLIVSRRPEARARFSEGQLDLSLNRGERSVAPARDAYVDLPNGILKKLGGRLSFEIWCTQTEWATFANTFRFEKSATEGEAVDAPRPAIYRSISIQQRRFGNDLHGLVDVVKEAWVADAKFDLAAGKEHHFALVLDPDSPGTAPGGTLSLYLDGYLVAASSLPAGFLDDFEDNNNWLGRGCASDPMFIGYYNEFRLYDKALTADEVLASYLAGPDAEIGAKP